MKFDPDEHCNAPFEVIDLHRDGRADKALYFELHEGEPFNAQVNHVLRRSGLWLDLTPEVPVREYPMVLHTRYKVGNPAIHIVTVKVDGTAKAEDA